jgi:hypothetical protein
MLSGSGDTRSSGRSRLDFENAPKKDDSLENGCYFRVFHPALASTVQSLCERHSPDIEYIFSISIFSFQIHETLRTGVSVLCVPNADVQ